MRLLFSITFFCFVCLCSAQHKSYYLLAGTYTNAESKGIYVYKFNEDSAAATLVGMAKTDNPSYLAISHNHKFVYSVKEGGKDNTSEVIAYSFDIKTGQLTYKNKQPTKSDGPCYISVDSHNKWVFTANYKGGSISCLPVKIDGSLDTVTQLIQHVGSSTNKARQKEPHAHTVVFSPDEKYLLSTDLGTDKINRYTFTPSSNTTPLSDDTDSVAYSTPGNGPRHLAFAPNKKFVYVINELSGTVDVFAYNHNRLILIQNISTDSTDSTNKGSADIHLSPDGKFLYATNRGNYNTIASFVVNAETGKLKLLKVQPTGGIVPRNFIITPSGKMLLVAHQKSDYITLFDRDIKTGLLTLTDKRIPVVSAVCLKLIDTE